MLGDLLLGRKFQVTCIALILFTHMIRPDVVIEIPFEEIKTWTFFVRAW